MKTIAAPITATQGRARVMIGFRRPDSTLNFTISLSRVSTMKVSDSDGEQNAKGYTREWMLVSDELARGVRRMLADADQRGLAQQLVTDDMPRDQQRANLIAEGWSRT